MEAEWVRREAGRLGGQGVSEICIMTYNVLAAKYGTSGYGTVPSRFSKWALTLMSVAGTSLAINCLVVWSFTVGMQILATILMLGKKQDTPPL
jgi:hypothetical protein